MGGWGPHLVLGVGVGMGLVAHVQLAGEPLFCRCHLVPDAEQAAQIIGRAALCCVKHARWKKETPGPPAQARQQYSQHVSGFVHSSPVVDNNTVAPMQSRLTRACE